MDSKCQGCKRLLPNDAFSRGNKTYKRCETCRQKRIKNTQDRQICATCGIRARFNFPDQTRGIRCSKHKDVGMVDISRKKCDHPGCTHRPSYNFKYESRGKFCVEHKQEEMVDVVSKKCVYIGCTKRPTFNVEGQSEGKFCADHRDINMVDVKSKKCAHIGCTKHPAFNFEGEKGGKFCANHKDVNMINVLSKKCSHVGCNKRPCFNFGGESEGKFCADHRDINMVDVKSKKCSRVGCMKQPIFNLEGEKRGKFCADHMDANMVDVKSKKCSYIGCNKGPNFNFVGESEGKFCSEHKAPNMIDVKHKKCDNCDTRASYGVPGLRASACAKHKAEGTCKYPTARCQAEDCKEKATYGINRPLHCEEHRLDQEQNLCLRKCKNCSHLEICNNEGLCFEYCVNSDLFRRSKHQKEIRVQNLLKREIQEQPHSCDKIIDSSCNKKRPDILYDCKTHFLAIEIDEHQHSSYQTECETTRMKEICQAIGMPTIFIRYNPDNYTDSQSKKSKIPKAKREQILVEWVRHCINSSPESDDQFLRVVYLFYDGFEPTKSSLGSIKII